MCPLPITLNHPPSPASGPTQWLFQGSLAESKILAADSARIVSTYRAYQAIEKFAYRATLEEIRENDHNLNILRYVDTFEEEAEIDLPAVQKEIDTLEAQLAARTEMRSHLEKLGLAPQ